MFYVHTQKKGTKAVYWNGTNMGSLSKKVYLLKRFRPSDSFHTFVSESVSYILLSRAMAIYVS